MTRRAGQCEAVCDAVWMALRCVCACAPELHLLLPSQDGRCLLRHWRRRPPGERCCTPKTACVLLRARGRAARKTRTKAAHERLKSAFRSTLRQSSTMHRSLARRGNNPSFRAGAPPMITAARRPAAILRPRTVLACSAAPAEQQQSPAATGSGSSTTRAHSPSPQPAKQLPYLLTQEDDSAFNECAAR